MENIDITVLRTLRDWRMQGKCALLVTVVNTWGSSPRPAGSIMALSEDGTVIGSVSGGCIEDDLVCRHTGAPDRDHTHDEASARPGIPDAPPRFVKYGITADEAHRFGLPCGGTLELLIESNPEPASLRELVQSLESGLLVQRQVCLADGGTTLTRTRQPCALTRSALDVVNTFGPQYRMLLVGAGQISICLATMALFSGFAVTVCDPREEYGGGWPLAGATLVRDMPDDVVLAFRPDRRSCVVALTHDPKLDDLALMEALVSDAFYVGALGSRRNNSARRQRLAEHFGLTSEQLARLHGPVGIAIGSKTPPEIAVSAMAEILAVKNGVAPERDAATARGGSVRRAANTVVV